MYWNGEDSLLLACWLLFSLIFLSAMGMGRDVGQSTPLCSQAGLVRREDCGPCDRSLNSSGPQVRSEMEHGISQRGLSGNYMQAWSYGYSPWHIGMAPEIVFLFCVTHGESRGPNTFQWGSGYVTWCVVTCLPDSKAPNRH